MKKKNKMENSWQKKKWMRKWEKIILKNGKWGFIFSSLFMSFLKFIFYSPTSYSFIFFSRLKQTHFHRKYMKSNNSSFFTISPPPSHRLPHTEFREKFPRKTREMSVGRNKGWNSGKIWI